MRLDKNGIPVLDPPGENKLKKKRKCLPDEHDWAMTEQFKLNSHHEGTHYYCRKCDEKDFEPDPIDEQLLPWL